MENQWPNSRGFSFTLCMLYEEPRLFQLNVMQDYVNYINVRDDNLLAHIPQEYLVYCILLENLWMIGRIISLKMVQSFKCIRSMCQRRCKM